MIRRRRRQSAADKVSRKKKKRKSKKKHNEKKLKSPTKEVYVHDDCSIVIGISCATLVRQYSKEAHRGEDHTSLSKMETLSKKLHAVEVNGAFVPDCDNSSMGSGNKQRSVTSDLDQAKRRVHIVEDDSRIDTDDDDSGTFISAKSHRTRSTVAALKSTKKPQNEVYRSKTSPRQFKFTETMEDNALAAQIEAMAAQADAAFEDRSKKDSPRGVATYFNFTYESLSNLYNLPHLSGEHHDTCENNDWRILKIEY